MNMKCERLRMFKSAFAALCAACQPAYAPACQRQPAGLPKEPAHARAERSVLLSAANAYAQRRWQRVRRARRYGSHICTQAAARKNSFAAKSGGAISVCPRRREWNARYTAARLENAPGTECGVSAEAKKKRWDGDQIGEVLPDAFAAVYGGSEYFVIFTHTSQFIRT
jgi:hypothetical protein